jgi:DNA ligase 1
MKRFAELITALDQTNKTNAKVEALENYFLSTSAEDKLWAVAILSGRRPKRTIRTSLLWDWSLELSNIPDWLLSECYQVVGDMAETIALLLPDVKAENTHSLKEWMLKIIDLEGKPDEYKKIIILNAWNGMDYYEKFVFNKLITGSFRIGVSQNLVIKALAKASNTDPNVITHKLMGNWSPLSSTMDDLLSDTDEANALSRPYPFYLAYALDQEPETLGEPEQWLAEWKWDGIRGQIVKRNGSLFVWSRGEDLITDRFPEFQSIKEKIPDGTVIDGEILAFRDVPLSFNILQTRIGRKDLTKKVLDAAPVAMLAYDLLELKGNDLRQMPLSERRLHLENIIKEMDSSALRLSPIIEFKQWEELTEKRKFSRENNSEGIMLKLKSSPYESGRKRGKWWKWKIDPLTIDAVLIYAQRGHGRRANLYTDYTFAVWDQDTLVPFAKAYSGLTDKELQQVDAFIKKNTKEKFGPVRSVKPELVFEIAFEGINSSPRHKSGVALRFPRILRWRIDKPPDEADSLENLKNILQKYGSK